MRMQSRTLLAGIGAATAVAALLVGCGGQDKNPNNPTTTAGQAGGQVEIGNTINYGSFGTTTDLDCADGKSLNVGGSNTTLTVRGTCSSVNIGGADNKITFEKIGTDISIVGLNNTITYKNGDPKVSNLGSGNTINKG